MGEAQSLHYISLIKIFCLSIFYSLYFSAYRTAEGKPWVLPVVRTVEAQMATDPTLNHEYLPVAGLPDFRDAACELILGKKYSQVDYFQLQYSNIEFF